MATDTNAYENACQEIADVVAERGISEAEGINKLKKEISRKYGLRSIPRHSDVLKLSRNELKERLKRKRMRTASGVAPVAVMTSPYPCPHGKCIMCPGGPFSDFESPQSYVGREPAALRAAQHGFDPYEQVKVRLRQLDEIGHDFEKVELILMGGTLTARPLDYQSWFVGGCLEAMKEFGEARGREIRNTGITFETRPDYAKEEQIDRMLELGATKVELGVQQVNNKILENMGRGHSVEDSIVANRRARDSALKVGFHVMPGLPGSTPEEDKKMFERIFRDSNFKPDYLKIYPTLVVKGTKLYEQWKSGEYEPIREEEAIEIIAYAKRIIPKWVRIQRIQRDIPAQFIEAGVKKSNLRQLAKEKLHEMGYECRCIRCREAGLSRLNGKVADDSNIKFFSERYEACNGTECFLSYEDVENDILIALLRLRFPSEPHRAELKHAALVRDLHVYGELVPVGEEREHSWQHRGYGARLLKQAEEMALDKEYGKMAVMSGIGVREYYERFGYKREGPFMVKNISFLKKSENKLLTQINAD
ncbi:MAG: tRNA uridine(34) 5-carboxymethylaminomethyl modification radical SAM/GNAT enzyme Elp3 [Candidatus Syntrophoarchaeum sp.]|nr:tRNA uridine(34) 5-carboxymethylaminomethyl modification radical SAM/GNAT enzyme Elp3 [Candidatus Syntrophoarchaeum sp.]